MNPEECDIGVGIVSTSGNDNTGREDKEVGSALPMKEKVESSTPLWTYHPSSLQLLDNITMVDDEREQYYHLRYYAIRKI